MKRWIFAGSILIAFLIYGLYLNFYQISVVKTELETQNAPGFFDYRGLTHVHSDRSTGSGSPEEIIEVAKDFPMDFLFIAEVNQGEPIKTEEGYHGRLLVLSGGEYSYLDSRLLYYNAPPHQPPEKKGQAQVYFTDLLSQKNRGAESGFIALAHPHLRGYQWTGDYPEGLDGIEIINHKRVLDHAWRESKIRTLWSLFIYPFNPTIAFLLLFEEPTDELVTWDQLGVNRPVFGLMGTDATAKAILFPNTSLKFPSYEASFSISMNHLLLRGELTGSWTADRKKVLAALQAGQMYMSLDMLGNPKGFAAEFISGGESYNMGETIRLSKNSQIHVRLPNRLQVPFEIVIVKDGQNIATFNQPDISFEVKQPGVYRVVVRVIPMFPLPYGKRWVSWIYSNPFYVRN